MKVLFVWPIAEFSVWDVARGYRLAFAKQFGEENIRDYYISKHTDYHRRAAPANVCNNPAALAKLASETIVTEALYHDIDVVFIVSGLNVHPICAWALRKVGIHAAIMLTESPYEDENQADWCSAYPEMTVFTNERTSADKYGWNYVPHSFDPAIHKPVEADFNDSCDVLMVGTGWKERQEFLEAVDWTGIDLRLYGIWPAMTPESKIYDYVWPVCIPNIEMPRFYAGAKICLNFHRHYPGAYSLNPRAFEVAACGGFLLSDYREEAEDIFGISLPTFTTPEELGKLVREFLADDDRRINCAKMAQEVGSSCTFDNRAVEVIRVIESAIQRKSSVSLVGS